MTPQISTRAGNVLTQISHEQAVTATKISRNVHFFRGSMAWKGIIGASNGDGNDCFLKIVNMIPARNRVDFPIRSDEHRRQK